MAIAPNTNINIPYSAFLDPTTGRPTQAWLLWLMNPNVISQTVNYMVINGGQINDTTVGLLTPAAGKFTDLTALNGIGGGTF